jgi:hypothetical protein
MVNISTYPIKTCPQYLFDDKQGLYPRYIHLLGQSKSHLDS